VVGVSWYEALAFCRWLGEQTGENILLPTEQQWQRAAQGDDNRTYPWGEGIDDSRCNYSRNVGRTTPVTNYPAGASPYGVMDMSGNVWEWCLTQYDDGSEDIEGTNRRVLRGGSWNNSDHYVRAAYRYYGNPYDWYYSIGFRVVYVRLPSS
jgi:formylglycine-generating enzyme required for sulfatase activity